MNPWTGELYSPEVVAQMNEAAQAELVMLEGREEFISHISLAMQQAALDDVKRREEQVLNGNRTYSSGMNRAERRRANRKSGLHSNGTPK